MFSLFPDFALNNFTGLTRQMGLGLLLVMALLGACSKQERPASEAGNSWIPPRQHLRGPSFGPSQPSWRPGPEQQQILLEGGQVQEHWIEPGQVHHYRIPTPANWFGRVEVLQCNLDLMLNLKDGDQSIRVDRPNATFDSEWVSFFTRDEKYLFLDVFSPGGPGYYQIELVFWQSLKPGDEEWVRREREYLQASQLAFGSDEVLLNKAFQQLQELQPYFKKVGDRYTLGLSYYHMGKVQEKLGHYDRAILLYKSAEKLFRKTGSTMESVVANNIGYNYYLLSDHDQAMSFFYRALTRGRGANLPYHEARILINLSMMYDMMAEYQLALNCLEQARKSVVGTSLEEPLYNSLGVVYSRLGESEKAMEFYGDSLALAQKSRNHQAIIATNLNLAHSFVEIDELDQALKYYQQARSELGSRESTYNLDHAFGNYYLAAGDVDLALSFLEKAPPEGPRLSSSWYDLGRARLQKYNNGGDAAYLEEAIINFESALELARQHKYPILEANSLLMLALAEENRNPEGALRFMEQGITIIEAIRGNVEQAEFRNTFFASNQTFYEHYIRLLMKLNARKVDPLYVRKALHQSERAIARHLVEVISNGRRNFSEGNDLTEFEAYWSARHRLEDLEQPDDEATDQVLPSHQQLAAARRDVARLEKQIRTSKNSNAKLGETLILNFDQIQAQISDPGTLILEYHLARELSWLWVISDQGLKSYQLPSIDELEPLINAAVSGYRKTGDLTTDQASIRLAQILLEPLLPLLGQIDRLAVVANGALQLVPFGALPLGSSQVLLDLVELVYLPSVSALAAIRQERTERKPAPRLLLAFADPVFSTEYPGFPAATDTRGPAPGQSNSRSWPRLFHTHTEANDILDLARKSWPKTESRARTGFEATRSAVLDPETGQYRILHFATHGLVDPQNPNRSALVLSLFDAKGKPLEGYLDLRDIAWLDLDAELVVLSACETALGLELGGEGLISLARGFMYAGAPRVVATLWQVSDDSTAILMKHFYHEMLVNQASPAKALRTAQLTLKNDYGLPPYNWAGFVLIGDWR